MSKPKFGTLKEVDIRELWKHEQYDFWNALPMNITLSIYPCSVT